MPGFVQASVNIINRSSLSIWGGDALTGTSMLASGKDANELLKEGSFNGMSVVMLTGDIASSSGAAAFLSDASSLGAFTFSTVGKYALELAGPVGAGIVLLCDTLQLAERCTAVKSINQKLLTVEKDSLEYRVLDAKRDHVIKMIASSTIAVAVDTLAVLITTPLPIVSLPVNAVAFATSIGRIAFEESCDTILVKDLKKTTKEFKKKYPTQLGKDQDKEYLALKAKFDKATAIKKEKAAALDEASNAYQRLRDEPHRKLLNKAQQEDVEAEDNLKTIEAERLSKNLPKFSDFETYQIVKELIAELDPLIKEKMKHTDLIMSYELAHPAIFPSSHPLHPSNKEVFKERLNEKLSVARDKLHKIDSSLAELETQISKSISDLENFNLEHSNKLMLSKEQREKQKELHIQQRELFVERGDLEFEKHHLQETMEQSENRHIKETYLKVPHSLSSFERFNKSFIIELEKDLKAQLSEASSRLKEINIRSYSVMTTPGFLYPSSDAHKEMIARLQSEKQELQDKIAQIKKEQKALKTYIKSHADLNKVKEKIAQQRRAAHKTTTELGKAAQTQSTMSLGKQSPSHSLSETRERGLEPIQIEHGTPLSGVEIAMESPTSSASSTNSVLETPASSDGPTPTISSPAKPLQDEPISAQEFQTKSPVKKTKGHTVFHIAPQRLNRPLSFA